MNNYCRGIWQNNREKNMKKSVTENYNGKKVSDIFEEYTAPLLELYFEGVGNFDADELEHMLQLPWLVWNSMIMQHDVKNKVDYHTSINLLLRNRPDAKMVVDAMRRRKKEMFEQYDLKTRTVSLWAEAETLS
jgi:hypothetical protein